MKTLREAIRSILAESRFPAPGTTLRVVEPIALVDMKTGDIDTFGHEEKLVMVGNEGTHAQVRSPRTGRRYQISPLRFERAFQAMTPPTQKGRPVPTTLRGRPSS